MPSSSEGESPGGGTIDRILRHNRSSAPTSLGSEPRPRLAATIVTCMDCRIDPVAHFGLERGDVHVLRNAGGIVTEDVLRSLAVSQAALGTREVLLVQHTGCGMAGVDEATLRDVVAKSSGIEPTLPLLPFPDVEATVRAGLATLRATEILTHRNTIRGFVLDVDTGRLSEIDPADSLD
jgi:carbonic anhydrase